MNDLETIKQHLTAAESAARAYAVQHPGNAVAQALRARCHAALELCESPGLPSVPVVPVVPPPKK